MSAGRPTSQSISERIKAAYERGRRASLVPQSCFELAVREWLKEHPNRSLTEAKEAVERLLGEALRTGGPRELAEAQ